MTSSAFLITQTNPTAGRFLQADTIVPQLGDVRGNPLRYSE